MRYVGIDPSTATGLVILDEQANVLVAEDVSGVGSKDPHRVGTLVDKVIGKLSASDKVCIEGFAYGAQGQGVAVQYGLGYLLRDRLYRKQVAYDDVAPAAVKKFATGKGNTTKDNMTLPIQRKWGFEHNSNNVRDAYVLARIALELDKARQTGIKIQSPLYQCEVINTIINPPPPKPTNKRKKEAQTSFL